MRNEKKFNKILRARELRKEMTQAEQILWKYLRNREFLSKKFRRQYIFRGFILDFYCPEDKLAIELDGSIHLKQKGYDLLRQNLLADLEIKTLRFNNNDILNDLKKVLQTIKEHLSVSNVAQTIIKDKLSLSISNGEGR